MVRIKLLVFYRIIRFVMEPEFSSVLIRVGYVKWTFPFLVYLLYVVVNSSLEDYIITFNKLRPMGILLYNNV